MFELTGESNYQTSDFNLFSLVQQGNEKAFAILVERYQHFLFLTAYHNLKNEDEAKDAVQEIFIYIWEKRNKIAIKTSLRSYLYMAINHYCLNFFRSQARLNKRKWLYQYFKEPINKHRDKLEEKELGIAIKTAIDHIPPASREVFQMQYIEGLTQKEIAERRNVSVQTVKNQVVFALSELRGNLKKA